MNSFALGTFQQFLRSANQTQAANVALAYPVLLSESVWPEFAAWAGTQAPDTQARAAEGMALLSSMCETAKAKWDRYPFGPGPLDEILRQIAAGEIDEEQAAAMAGTPVVVQNLSPVYVRARMMQYARQAMDGDWKIPLVCDRVVLAAIAARKFLLTFDQKALESIAAIEYSYVAKMAIWETADGRFLKHSVQLLNHVRDFEAGPWNSAGQAEYALGQVYLDPYVYMRKSDSFDQRIAAWMRLPFENLGSLMTAELAKEVALPAPLDAFSESSRNFLSAAGKQAGSDRGLSLKGYIQAEVWKKIAGGTPAQLSDVAGEAQGLLAGDRYADARAEIAAAMRFAGQPVGAAKTQRSNEDWATVARDLLAADSAQLVAQRGPVRATDLLVQVAQALGNAEPALALALWRKNLPLMLQREPAALESFLESGIGYAINALAETRTKSGEEALQRARQENWPEDKLAATLLFLAAQTQTSNNELEGVQLVGLAVRASQSLAQEWAPLYLSFTGFLYSGEASNQFGANNYQKAVEFYAHSSLYYLKANLSVRAAAKMEAAIDLVNRDNGLAGNFAAYFGLLMPELERQCGSELVGRVFQLGRALMPMMVKDGGLSPLSLPLLGMLKGTLLSAAWRVGGPVDWIASEESQDILKRIDALRCDVPAGGTVLDVGGLDLDDLLTVFAEETETVPGDSAGSVLHNLEARYDGELRRHISQRVAAPPDWAPSLENVRAALGPETVLIDYYSGNLPNGNAGLYVHVLTQESATGTLADFGSPGMQTRIGRGNGYAADVLALPVSSLRREVRADPQGKEVTEKAHGLLAGLNYIAPLETLLRGLHAKGKWHLCIVPHAPLYFFPFHLLPYAGGLLSDEWTVTYLPALGLLGPGREEGPARAREIDSFGMDFTGGVPHDLPEIAGSEDEARAVAACFGAAAKTGSAATETAMVDALANAKRIHLSTHGLHAVNAPSFQRVYLTPDRENDGILYAWELLRYDLRGLDVLTLSACETALGRIDKGDNLRGLAANALVAGASTVVGTLWPVRSEVTKTFFESFYGEIAGGSEKREAFHIAQLTARDKHPEFRDWGAFNYTGFW